MSTLSDVVASRTLEIVDQSGTVVGNAVVRIGRPTQEPGGEWSLPYQVVGLGDDTVYRVLGFDGVQVLQGVHLVIGGLLASTDEAEQGRLRWAGKTDLGFPIPTGGDAQ